RERDVEHQHGRRPRYLLGALDLEVLGRDANRRAAAGARDRVLDRARDVEVQRVAELVGLVLVGALVPEARALDFVPAGAVLEEPAEQVAERALADAADALRRELHAPFTLFDEAGFLEHLGELGELRERTRRVVAEEVADAVEVDLGELTGVR